MANNSVGNCGILGLLDCGLNSPDLSFIASTLFQNSRPFAGVNECIGPFQIWSFLSSSWSLR